MSNKRILILTADAGFGHRSAANAVAAAMRQVLGANAEIEVANPLNDPQTPALLRDSQLDYDRLVRELPDLYKLGYEASAEAIPNALIGGGVTVLLFDVLRRMLKARQPDLIITTYPLYQAPLDALFTLMPPPIPLITVVTDLSWVHRAWFHRAVTALAVPTPEVRDQAVVHHITLESIYVTGIPVSLRFDPGRRDKPDKPDKPALKRALGWREDLLTVLAVGSTRVLHLGETLRALNHSGLPLQLAVVAGGDDAQYAAFQVQEWHLPTQLYNFANNLPDMMCAADCILCKAGGLVVSEALACGLPLLLTEVIPGQEQGNADYVTRSRAGKQISSPIDALETLFHWIANDAERLKQHAERARAIGHPDAALKIAEIAQRLLAERR